MMAIGPNDLHPDLIGSTIAERYTVRRRLATGGMGTVYEAVHVELGRMVAVKVLSAGYSSHREAIARFQREARAAGRIEHPNIVQILDLGNLDSGEPYLVMELLEGEDLADRIARQGALTPQEVVEILEPIARALDAVHREGVLHRDVKPANIFLAKRIDGTEVPKLLDFGLAALQGTPEHERLTKAGIVVGTPEYVSPEAAEGKELDERTDVYSLGLVAFEMLTGVLPIDSDTPIAVLHAKVRRPAPTMSQRTGRTYPPALEELLGRTLSRTPSNRPRSAGELVSELKKLAGTLPAVMVIARKLPHLPSQQRRYPSTAETQTSLPMVRGRFWLATAAVIALVGGLAIWLAHWEPEPTPVASTTPTSPAHPRAEPELALPVIEAAPEIPMPEPAPSRREVVARTVPTVQEAPRPPAIPVPAEAPARAEEPARVEEPAQVEEPVRTEGASADPGAPPVVNSARIEALVREAGSMLLRGQMPRARALYREAAYADPDNSMAWRGLGIASERMGLAPEAASAYRNYLRIAPAAADARQIRERLERMEAAR
jgi:serine/threonine protein kinase